MVSRIARMETTVVRSEAEALLLENNLIKALAPRFNIRFVDDKSYPYLKIASHRFPRVAYYRGAVDQKHRYFGPFPSAWAVKDSIQLLQKVFHLRTCEDTVFANRTRPCLLYQIKRCSGPCVDYISPDDYARDVANAERFLQGEQQELMDSLQAQMMARAEALQFEQAAEIRNQIGSLAARAAPAGGRGQHRRRAPSTPTSSRSRSTAGAPASTWRWCAAAAISATGPTSRSTSRTRSRSGRQRERRAPTKRAGLPRPSSPKCACSRRSSPSTTSRAACRRCWSSAIRSTRRWSRPSPRAAACATTVQHQPREPRRAWLDMCIKGAALRLAQLLAEEGSQQARTRALVEALDLAVDDLHAFRIECFDVSHTAGEATQASCVVFEAHKMQSAQYRRYNIAGITPGDDYAAMRQVLTRRYAKLVEAARAGQRRACPTSSWSTAARGQVSVAREVFEELGIELSRIVGVEKGEGRKVGLEELVFADGRPKVALGRESAALMLVAQIRDEAHRFAITGMRARRASVRTGASSLEEIPGVGPEEARQAAAALRRRARRRQRQRRGPRSPSTAFRASSPRRSIVPCIDTAFARPRRVARVALLGRRGVRPAGLLAAPRREARRRDARQRRRHRRAAAPPLPVTAPSGPAVDARRRCRRPPAVATGPRCAARRPSGWSPPTPTSPTRAGAGSAARDSGARDRAQRRRQRPPHRGPARAAPGQGHDADRRSTRCAARRRSATSRACRSLGSSSRPSSSTTAASSSRAPSID